jgi:hypothetical protein
MVLDMLEASGNCSRSFGFQIITEACSPEDSPCWKLAPQSKVSVTCIRLNTFASFILDRLCKARLKVGEAMVYLFGNPGGMTRK